LNRNLALVVCRVGPGGVRPGKIAPTGADPDPPITANRHKLRTDCGPQTRLAAGGRGNGFRHPRVCRSTSISNTAVGQAVPARSATVHATTKVTK